MRLVTTMKGNSASFYETMKRFLLTLSAKTTWSCRSLTMVIMIFNLFESLLINNLTDFSSGARVFFSPWRRATSWTWSTSQRGSSPSPSPAAWRSRATLPTWGRWPPCCAPNTATTTWYRPQITSLSLAWVQVRQIKHIQPPVLHKKLELVMSDGGRQVRNY